MDTTVKATAVSGHQREYLFDNYKVLLILLVVIGHFIEPSNDQNPFLYELKWGIVAFHMPAFIFISGYFSYTTSTVDMFLLMTIDEASSINSPSPFILKP